MDNKIRKMYLLRKIALFIIHGLALAAFAIGVVMIYSNDNFKKGFTRMNNEVYEDSLVFVEQFENDIVYITDYIATRDIFEIDGEMDLDKHILDVDNGPVENVEYTIKEVLTKARQMGYYFDENYQLQKSPDAESNPNITDQVIVDWDNYDPDHSTAGPADNYSTWDDFVKDLLGKLSRYTIARDRLFSDPTNVLFYAVSDDNIISNSDIEDQVEDILEREEVSEAVPAGVYATTSDTLRLPPQTTAAVAADPTSHVAAGEETAAAAEIGPADVVPEAAATPSSVQGPAAETASGSEETSMVPLPDEAGAASASEISAEAAVTGGLDTSYSQSSQSTASGVSGGPGTTITRDTPVGVDAANQDISSRNDKLSQNQDYEDYENHFAAAQEVMMRYGRYAIIESDDLLVDTNLTKVPENLAYLSSKVLAGEASRYFLAIAIDTSYPSQDVYYLNDQAYSYERNSYFAGLMMSLAGAGIMFTTLAFLISMAGKATPDARTATLLTIDRSSPEGRVASCLIAIILVLVFCDNIGSKLLHLYLGSKYWKLAELMLKDVCVYACTTFTGFSLIRSAKAGILWEKSRIKHALDDLNRIMRRESFSKRSLHRSLIYLITNIVLITLTVSMIFMETTLIHRVIILALITATVGWNFFCFYSQTKKSAETDLIGEAIKRIAGGDIGYQLDLTSFEGKELDLASDINNISSGLDASVNEQTKAERMKANLITNVSHDIKTPLTSIINYVDLIKRRNPQDEKIVEYLGILEQKSHYLKSLTEDLIEASKVSSGNVTLHMATLDLVELVYQADGEFEEKYAERGLKIIENMPEGNVLIWADGEALWRVLENVYNNAYKYAQENSRIYVEIEKKPGSFLGTAGTELTVAQHSHGSVPAATDVEGDSADKAADSSESAPQDPSDEIGTHGTVIFTLKNISASQLNISAQELTERFVRGDDSRTTEGHGLGLSIASSLTQLQGGRFEIKIDGDLFKAVIEFPY
jgi:signal transduction histidine kinase